MTYHTSTDLLARSATAIGSPELFGLRANAQAIVETPLNSATLECRVGKKTRFALPSVQTRQALLVGEAEASVSLPVEALRQTIEAVSRTMEFAGPFRGLDGAMFELLPCEVRAYSTDGHRLTVASAEAVEFIHGKAVLGDHNMKHEPGHERTVQYFVPHCTIQALKRVLRSAASKRLPAGTEATIRFGFAVHGRRLVNFEVGADTVCGETTEQRFPNALKVIPSTSASAGRVVIPAKSDANLRQWEAAMRAKYDLKRSHCIYARVIVEVQDGAAIMALAPMMQGMEEEVLRLAIEYDGPQWKSGVDAAYLREAIEACGPGPVEVLLGANSRTPYTFRPVEGARHGVRWFQMVMPVRT